MAYTLALALFAAGVAAAAPSAGPTAPTATPGVPSASERRAVRGTAVDGSLESPELRELRRFESAAFPRYQGLPIKTLEPEQAAGDESLPLGLRGRWTGSGDVPAVLRTPPVERSGAVPTAAAPAWLSTLSMPELPVRWEPAVLRYLEFFKDDPRGRATMEIWLRRLGRYKTVFERILHREGLPRDLVYLAMIESGFDPGAVSTVGAGGVWQFMREVARAYGLEVNYWLDGRRDPEAAGEAAARYLKDLYVRFGSWHLAFAAYNAGYGAVLQSITRYNTNDYWELSRHEAGLPWDTTLYVPKLLAVAVIGHNLAAFGFGNLVMDPPLSYEEVTVPPGTTLAAVAQAAGTTVETLDGLNPELVRGRTPPDRGPRPVRVPLGAGTGFAETFARAHGSADAVTTVVLRFGETLGDVAKRHHTSEKELRRLNRVRATSELRGGTTIVVPVRTEVARASTPPAPDAETTGDGADIAAPAVDVARPEPTLVAVPEREFNYPERDRVFFRTSSSDTLEEVAGVFEVSAENLVEWNHLDPTARLQTDMVLQIFVGKEFDRRNVALLDPESIHVVTLGSEEFLQLQAAVRGRTRLVYTARAGDTLTKLARRYGVKPGDLARINRFSFNTELDEGKKVVVYAPNVPVQTEHMGRAPTPAAHRPSAPAPAPRSLSSKPETATKPSTTTKGTPPAKPAAVKSGSTPKPAAGKTAAK